MIRLILVLLFCLPGIVRAQPIDSEVPVEQFAQLALSCLHQEYPNKIAHVMSQDGDVAPPRELTPVFYGCFDWHSAVHGHWLLVRLLRLYPDSAFSREALVALEQSFQADKVAIEVEYARHPHRASFERPYGIAWLLQLMAELREWDHPAAHRWKSVLEPLEAVYVEKTRLWLNKLAYPIRVGEHAQTAFAFALFLDWAETSGDKEFAELVGSRSLDFHSNDVNCPLAYEPGGQDFLSPCLAEADLMRRVMRDSQYRDWLSRFLPQIPETGDGHWIELAQVTDRSDGKLAHLDGLHLARAWALDGMLAGVGEADPRHAAILAARDIHARAGLASVTGEHYEGGHWLGSFATYLVTRRGISPLISSSHQDDPDPANKATNELQQAKEHAATSTGDAPQDLETRGLKQTGDQGLSLDGIVGEARSIPGLIAEGAWCEVAEGEEGEGEACE